MQKLDPELKSFAGDSVDTKCKDLLTSLLHEKRNTVVCCSNLHSLNLLASCLKKNLAQAFPNAVFYSDNEFEKFIADSLIDQYGTAFSELIETESSNKSARICQSILIIRNGERLDETEISILKNLVEQTIGNGHIFVIFLNAGLSSVKFEKTLNKFDENFNVFDAKNIKDQPNEKSLDVGKERDLVKEKSISSQEALLDGLEDKTTQQSPKKKKQGIKVLFLSLLIVIFIATFNEGVLTSILKFFDLRNIEKTSFLKHNEVTCQLTKRDSLKKSSTRVLNNEITKRDSCVI